MIDISKIQDGDRLFSHGTAAISKDIEHWMTVYRDNGKFKIDPGVLKLLNGFIASHCATFFWVQGKLYIYGSIEYGYRPIVFTDHYSDADSFLVLRSRDGYTASQKIAAFNYAMQALGDSTIYPYWALPMWIAYVKTGWKWFLSGGGHRAQVCYKSVYQVLKAVEPEKYTVNPLYATFFDDCRPDDQPVIRNNI